MRQGVRDSLEDLSLSFRQERARVLSEETGVHPVHVTRPPINGSLIRCTEQLGPGFARSLEEAQ